MKRKSLNRSGWIGIEESRYVEHMLKSASFEGMAAIFYVDHVSKPTRWGDIAVLDDGYRWLEYIEKGRDCAVSAMLDRDGSPVHWYIDVIAGSNFEYGETWVDDLYLDLQLFADGRQMICDRDELDQALAEGDIDDALHRRALDEMDRLLAETGDFAAFKAKTLSLYKAALLLDSPTRTES